MSVAANQDGPLSDIVLDIRLIFTQLHETKEASEPESRLSLSVESDLATNLLIFLLFKK